VIGTPLNDLACLSKFTDVARGALEREELHDLASRFLEAGDYDTDAALDLARSWLRDKPQENDTGHGPEPRVNCGTVQQRVDYLGREPNCVERTIAYTAIAELIDPSTTRQMATIGTPGGLHTFPVEEGRYPVVLDPKVTRNGLRAGIWSLRNGNGNASAGFTPDEIVSWALYLAEGQAAPVRNGPTRLASAERALERLWDNKPLAEGECSVRNSIADIAWTFALAEQAARAAGGHGIDAMRIGSMAVQRLIESRTRNLSWRSVKRTVVKVGRRAGRLTGPALKAYLISYGVPPQAVDRVAAEVETRADIDLGGLGFKAATPGSLEAIAQSEAAAVVARSKTNTTKEGR